MNEYDILKNQINDSIKNMRVHINRIIGAAVMLEQLPDSNENLALSELIYSSCKLLTQNINLSYNCSEELFEGSKTVLNSGEILQGIVDECSRLVAPVNRRIDFINNCTVSGVKMDDKAFTVVFMNLIQNALLYSPSDCIVRVKMENSGGNVVIVIENSVDSGKTADYEGGGLGLALSRRIAEWHNGSLDYSKVDGVFTVTLVLPICNETVGISFGSDYAEYVSERFKPVNLFMNDVTRSN
ncbi:MAG: HAMP domain-containing histidine kinase [Oscillospiraceae bacterium]|nr:HAMP domain-containing histidine kinase [Oscillospiraceae bacterium]